MEEVREEGNGWQMRERDRRYGTWECSSKVRGKREVETQI